jgi:hypothetical protein
MQKLKDGALAVLRNRVELPMRNIFDAAIISTESKPKGRIKTDEIERSDKNRKVSFNKVKEVLGEATDEDEFVIISSSVQEDDQVYKNITDSKGTNDIGENYDIINDHIDSNDRILLDHRDSVEIDREGQPVDINMDTNEYQEFKDNVKKRKIDNEDEDENEDGVERERRAALEMMMGLDDSSSGGDSDSDNDEITNASDRILSKDDNDNSDNDSDESHDNDIIIDDYNDEMDKNYTGDNVSTIDSEIELNQDAVVAEDKSGKVIDIENSVKDRRTFKDLHNAAWAIFISTLGFRTVRYSYCRCHLRIISLWSLMPYVGYIFP